jgi:hypothetical protein
MPRRPAECWRATRGCCTSSCCEALLIQGAAKRALLAQAATPGSALPLAALVRQRREGIEIFWCP